MPDATVHQLKISLVEAKPAIWRRVVVPSEMSLGDLHDIIQAAMGWTNSHLHQFEIGGTGKRRRDATIYSDPQFDMGDCKDEFKAALAKIAPKPRDKFVYLYDMGDGWEHLITVEKIVPASENPECPAILAGERACPPEDCGGIWGFTELMEAQKNPTEDDEERLEWLGEYDAEKFDIAEASADLPKRKSKR